MANASRCSKVLLDGRQLHADKNKAVWAAEEKWPEGAQVSRTWVKAHVLSDDQSALDIEDQRARWLAMGNRAADLAAKRAARRNPDNGAKLWKVIDNQGHSLYP